MEGMSTQDNSPMTLTPPLLENQVQRIHRPQCMCDAEDMSLLSRSYFKLIKQMTASSCCKAQSWLQHCNPPRNAEEVYYNLLEIPLDVTEYLESAKQIELDLNRTFPDEPYFINGEGQSALRRVLQAFSKYDIQMGYVQGMNFIAGALLWHATEVDAFWLFVGLMENYEIRDTYLPSLPGLSKHCQIIQMLIVENMPNLHRQFAEHRIGNEMFLAEWCFTLFGSAVPVDEMMNMLDAFFEKGWVFFYKFVLAILQCLEKKLLDARDPIEVLTPLKICHKSQKEWKKFLELLDGGRGKICWKSLIRKAKNLKVNEKYIRYLQMNFNLETGQFCLPKTHK